MILLIDMDGVVVDFVRPWLERYNALTGENVKYSDITGPNTSKFVGEPFLLKKIKDSVGFISRLPPIKDAVETITELHNSGNEIVFVSNGTNCPTSGHEKRDWLKFYFHRLWKFPPLVLTHKKHYVRGDVLLEDTSKNLEDLHVDTKGLLFHQKYNANENKFERIYDWSHFMQWVTDNRRFYE